MSMVCPQCNNAFEQRLSCPECNTRLYYQSGRGAPTGRGAGARWQQSALGRIALGLVLAQGLYYGLCRLYTSFSLAFKEQLALGETSPTTYMTLQGMQLAALLLGGILAGAGQITAVALGVVVGVGNGLLCALLQPFPGQNVTTVALYSQPVLHAVFGALAGWIGQSIWKPLPASLDRPATRLLPRLGAARRQLSLFAGRVAWVRVLTGTSLAVIGSLCATLILETATAAAANNIRSSATLRYPAILQMQDTILTWEIKALAILVGAALAGCNTRNGFKQGLFVGLATTFTLAGVLASQGRATLPILGGTVISAMCLSLVGGWFGSQLLPPIIRFKRARGVGPAGAF